MNIRIFKALFSNPQTKTLSCLFYTLKKLAF